MSKVWYMYGLNLRAYHTARTATNGMVKTHNCAVITPFFTYRRPYGSRSHPSPVMETESFPVSQPFRCLTGDV